MNIFLSKLTTSCSARTTCAYFLVKYVNYCFLVVTCL